MDYFSTTQDALETLWTLTDKCEDLTFLDNSFRFSSKEEQLMSLRVTRMSALLFIGGRPVGIPGWWI